jgi:Holliday junction resolvase YEN1
MNIQPIIIFDGPSRPWKRGGVAGRIDWKKIDLLRKTLNMLKIPHHRADVEAEAECARLNELGIVDAVWTDDGDAFMFGAKVLIKEHREGRGNAGKKSDNLVRIYRAEEIERKHRINRQGLVLFALLSRGDYDTKGLPGCGPIAALEAAQFDNGRLGKILCEIPLKQLHCFTESLRDYFQVSGTRAVYVPPGYPRDLHVKNHREPKVSTVEKANNLRGLQKGWYVLIDEAKLRPFLLATFNFDTKAYLKHILPVQLIKELVQTTPETLDKNRVFDLQLVHKRGRDHDGECLERQITFDPKKCTELNLWTKPDNEDRPESFDPTAPVEAEFLEYILVSALGETEMQRLKQLASQPKPKKRKTADIAFESGSQLSAETVDISAVPAAKKQKKASASQETTVSSASTSKAASKPATKPKPTKGHGKTIPVADPSEPTQPEVPTPPVKKGFQLPRALVRNPSMLSELASQCSQGVLSRSTSFQSFDSAGEPSRWPSTSFSVTASQDSHNEHQPRPIPRRTVRTETSIGSAVSGQVPPSSQLDPAAESWSFSHTPSLIDVIERPVHKPSLESMPNARIVQEARPVIINEKSPSLERVLASAVSALSQRSTVRQPLTEVPSRKRGWVVVDLASDDEDVFPAPGPSRMARIPPAQVAISQVPVHAEQKAPAPVLTTSFSSALDSREAIAAVRLKHFEKKVYDTIDLTLDD